MDWYIGTEWNIERKGIRKKVLDLKFQTLDKPHLVSKVEITIEQVKNLNGRKSIYLEMELETDEKNIDLEMGTAITPIDYYLELLVQQMIVGEKAECFIKTKANTEISFIVTLNKILHSVEIQKLNVKEMYDLALKYKENGVKMFKEYQIFAHEYFVRASKCLISYKPFDGLDDIPKDLSVELLDSLFIQIQTNLAACLLIQERYEDVIYHTNFVDTVATEPSEKSLYRRALAFLKLKEFEKAQKTIEKVPNYQEKKDFVKLLKQIGENWRASNESYKNIVKKMFN